jgi:class 3 adenylate cyclase/DNA-binding beta-propeller fold protein YncE
MVELPSGTITLLFTDIEGSTSLLKQLRDAYGDVLAGQRRIVRAAFATYAGREIDTQGDSFLAAFPRAKNAVLAAAAIQRALAEEPWPDGVSVRLRIGLHTGEPSVAAEGYHGLDLHRGARIAAAGHGGQILLSATTRALLDDADLPGLSFRDLGRRTFKDIDRPEHLFQLDVDGLPSEFAPVRASEDVELPLVARQRLSRVRYPLALATLGVAVLAAVVVAVLVLRGGGSKGLARLEPNSVGAVDPSSGRLVADVPVGTAPAAISYARGALWVANSGDGTVSRVDPKTLEARTVAVGRPSQAHPTAVAAGPGAVWIAQKQERLVERLDPRYLGQIIGSPTKLRSPPGAIALGDGVLWVASAPVLPIAGFNEPTVIRIDADGNVISRPILVDPGADTLAYGEGTLWVGGSGGVAPVDPRTAEPGSTVDLPGGVSGLAIGGGALWAALAPAGLGGNVSGSNAVARLQLDGSGVTATVPLDAKPTAIAYSSGSVWVASSTSERMWRIDARSNKRVGTIELGAIPTAIAVGGGRVWVSVR